VRIMIAVFYTIVVLVINISHAEVTGSGAIKSTSTKIGAKQLNIWSPSLALVQSQYTTNINSQREQSTGGGANCIDPGPLQAALIKDSNGNTIWNIMPKSDAIKQIFVDVLPFVNVGPLAGSTELDPTSRGSASTIKWLAYNVLTGDRVIAELANQEEPELSFSCVEPLVYWKCEIDKLSAKGYTPYSTTGNFNAIFINAGSVWSQCTVP
jgi:hypothetical protein